MKRWLTLGAAGVLALGMCGVAFAQPGSGAAQKEAAKAHSHAMMATVATSLKLAHTHFHHVINCLVGPQGKRFDASVADPCSGMGDGALPDSKGNKALHAQLDKALAAARKGLHTTTLKAAQADAATLAGLL